MELELSAPLCYISMVCALFVLLSKRLLRKIFTKSYCVVYNHIVVYLTLIGTLFLVVGMCGLGRNYGSYWEFVQEMCEVSYYEVTRLMDIWILLQWCQHFEMRISFGNFVASSCSCEPMGKQILSTQTYGSH